MPDLPKPRLDHSQSDRDFVASVTDPAACDTQAPQLDRLRSILLLFLLFFAIALVVENVLVDDVPASNSLLVVGFVFSAILYTRIDFKIKLIKLHAALTNAPRPPHSRA